eukprot:CAMPEP_0201717892 /NCGR_PEP_ID=MMETSP0593-20130828/3550_1 /ASSEMBLY_ACC=CAM_ASM_000672 /TAXON_ID=267983 /ORGANISM="Skeletonema japonicum, Strain CCMP2506" /LENGTH=345 /DNA_ID=CAMNT_0048208067 /DNA_START=74 /DNA_END=1111 /DNA_ORIENTATION=+
MKSKLKSRFQWGGGKNKGTFPTSEPKKYANTNIAPVRVDNKLNLDDNIEIHTPIHSNTTVSTLSNNDVAFSQKRSNCGFDSDERPTMREQMLYNKNQTCLKEKANADVGATSNVASMYASDKRWNRYDNDDGSDYDPDVPDSPCGVSELDSFNHKVVQRSDSETYTHQSSSLMDATDSTSVYDDDGTKSTFFYSEGGTEEDTNFEDVTLGTLDTSVGTRYEMAEFENSKTYKLGFGTAPSIRQRSKNVPQRSRSRSPPRIRRSNRNRSYSKDDADVINSRCPFPISDELKGTVEDVSLAFSQILHAFFISPDDVDRMSDKIRDARYDLKELQDSYRFRSSLPSRR